MFHSDLTLKNFIEKLPAAAYACSAEGRITYFNESAVRLWGREPKLDDPVDRYCGSVRLFSPDGTAVRHEECWMALALKHDRQYDAGEIVIERDDGSRRTALAHVSPLHDQQGRLIGAVNILVDITQQKQIEQELRRREKELQDFFENATLGLHCVGPDGTILRANRAELEMLGYSESEYIGRHIEEFHVDESAIDEILARLQNAEELHDFPARLRCKDGSIRHVVISSNVLWEHGKFIHTRCFTRDVTERKRAEMRLAAEHAVTRALSEADSFEEASPEILEAIRECLAADICLLWIRGYGNDELYCAEIASRPNSDELQPFIDQSREIHVTKGSGLPGRVWQTGEPHLIEDITQDTDFRRAETGTKSGLTSGIGFPMLSGKKFRGEIEFFTSRKLSQDDALLDMMAAIGSEIGLFIRRTYLRQQLKKEQARKAAVLDSALDCIITMDEQGCIVDFNGVAETTFRYKRDEVFGKPLAELLIPERFRQQHRDGLARFLETGESDLLGKRFELTGMRADGSEFPVEIAFNVLRSDQEAAPFFTAFARDITARRKAEERLRKSESDARRFALLVENSNDFIGITTPDGKAIYVNRAGRRMVGLDDDFDITTTAIMDYIATEDRDVMLNEAIPTVAKEKRWKGPVNYRHFKTGESIPTLWNAFVIEDPDGELPSVWVTISPDLTEQKRMEDALRKSAAENALLYEQAQTANQTKSEFLANMSHEIRTPMTAILGYADLLAAKLPDAEEIGFLRTINRNGRFLLEIINDILDLSKIEAGKIEIHRERFSIEPIVADIYSSMLVRADQKGLNLQVEYDGVIPQTIESDPTRVRQILLNLIGNAMKFTEAGSVLLKVRFLPDDDNPLLQFHVVDTGIGIEPKHQHRLFQAFSQGDASVTRKYGGTGLGLIISKRLASFLGGDIQVESEPGRGSTFSVTISTGSLDGVPLVQPRSVGEFENEVADSEPDRAATLNYRILVVDDRRDVRYLARIFLSKCGADVVEAEDGQAALAAIEKAEANGSPYDVILLDMQMPKLDGYQTAKRLREKGYQRPIIALTADAMRGDRERCLAAGCDGYLTKPIDRTELIDTVARFAQPPSYVPESVEPFVPPGPPFSDAGYATSSCADTESSASAAENIADHSIRRVLVVDDSFDACSATCRLLSLEGFEVQMAHDGASAIDAAHAFAPHVVLLDIALPDMDGYEVLRRLKDFSEFHNTRFVALSGRPKDIQRVRKAGFHDHLQKPADLNKLLALLNF